MIFFIFEVILASLGTAFLLLAAIGLVRLPDPLCRCHAIAKAMTLGISLLLAAVIMHLQAEDATLKLLLAMVFQFATIPVAGHLLMRLAYEKNMKRWKERPMDDHRTDAAQQK